MTRDRRDIRAVVAGRVIDEANTVQRGHRRAVLACPIRAFWVVWRWLQTQVDGARTVRAVELLCRMRRAVVGVIELLAHPQCPYHGFLAMPQ